MSVSSSNTLLADQSSTCGKTQPEGVTKHAVVAEEHEHAATAEGKVVVVVGMGGGSYLTPSGLHVEHVGRVMLQGDDLGKAHVFVEELRAKEDSRFD